MKKSIKITLIVIGVLLVLLVVGGFVAVRYVTNKSFDTVTDALANGNFVYTDTGENTEGMDETTANVADFLAKLTPEKAEKLKNAISQADKDAVIKVLMSAVPKEEWGKIAGMLEGGITGEELTQMMALVKDNLTDEQMAEILSYYEKYAYVLDE